MSLSIRDTAKFGLLVGLCAIFIDAVIAHGLFWENDPYWSRMPTRTLQMVEILGWVGLIGLALLFGWLAHREGRQRAER